MALPEAIAQRLGFSYCGGLVVVAVSLVLVQLHLVAQRLLLLGEREFRDDLVEHDDPFAEADQVKRHGRRRHVVHLARDVRHERLQVADGDPRERICLHPNNNIQEDYCIHQEAASAGDLTLEHGAKAVALREMLKAAEHVVAEARGPHDPDVDVVAEPVREQLRHALVAVLVELAVVARAPTVERGVGIVRKQTRSDAVRLL